MVLLGLHFGHDAAISVLKDGEVVLCVERERLNRVKHAIGLSADDVEMCLRDAGLAVSDVDAVCLTTTQDVEYVFTDPARLGAEFMRHHGDKLPCTLTDLGATPDVMQTRLIGNMMPGLRERDPDWSEYGRMFPEWTALTGRSRRMGALEHFVWLPLWDKVKTLDAMAQTDYAPLLSGKALRHGFHYPVSVSLLGRSVPGYLVSHHAAHLAYAYYQSKFDRAGILSMDGAGGAYGYLGGLFGYGQDHRIYPLTPHHLNAGLVYDRAAVELGLGYMGGAGKLMGLSGYGNPRFFSPEFVGNIHDVPSGKASPQDWIDHCRKAAADQGQEALQARPDPERVLDPVHVDFAASSQKLVEEMILRAAGMASACLARNDRSTANLCLSGGVALNCPANTRLARESAFRHVSVSPAVGDSGLAVGATQWLYHNVMEQPRPVEHPSPARRAYLGLRRSAGAEPIGAAIAQYSNRLLVTECDIAQQAAQDLHADRIIALFAGRSELGPRALGHRSILANPRFAHNWARVNLLKGREAWRPFAPAVLETHVAEYFDAEGIEPHFMLFNAGVRSGKIPAVTHVDGSARIQAVNEQSGPLFDILRQFHAFSGVPVLLNTSFNGRAEPIVEAPAEAIEFLLRTSLDVLYFEGYRVERRPQ